MYILFVALLLPLTVDAWRPFIIIIANHTEESYSTKVQLNASFTKSNKFNFNVEMFEIVRQPYLHVGLYFESNEGIHDLEIMNRTIDLCKFYKNKRYEPILQVIFKLFEETLTHWARTCPMQKGVYYLKDVELNVEKLPPFFPEKSGIYDSVLMNKQEKLFRIKVYFKISKTFKGN